MNSFRHCYSHHPVFRQLQASPNASKASSKDQICNIRNKEEPTSTNVFVSISVLRAKSIFPQEHPYRWNQIFTAIAHAVCFSESYPHLSSQQYSYPKCSLLSVSWRSSPRRTSQQRILQDATAIGLCSTAAPRPFHGHRPHALLCTAL